MRRKKDQKKEHPQELGACWGFSQSQQEQWVASVFLPSLLCTDFDAGGVPRCISACRNVQMWEPAVNASLPLARFLSYPLDSSSVCFFPF